MKKVISLNEIHANERRYSQITLNFIDNDLQKQYRESINLNFIDKKIKISCLSILLFLLIAIIEVNLKKDIENTNIINEIDGHMLFILIFFFYAFLLFLNIFLIKIENPGKKYYLSGYLIPLCNIIFNVAIFAKAFNENQSHFDRNTIIFLCFFSIFFDTEYLDYFLIYLLKCVFFFVLILARFC